MPGPALAEAAGTPDLIDPEIAPRSPPARSARTIGGWFSFQPLYDRIVREQPDLLD